MTRTRFTLIILTGFILAFAALEVVLGIRSFHWGDTPGIDLSIYLGATDRLLHGGPWFLDRQQAPYQVEMGDVLYPPTAGILFAPFLVLPSVLWWAIPIGLIAGLVWVWHPAPWTWPLMALCIAWPLTPARIITGNPAMWLAAATAAGLQWGWPGAFVILKPAMAPFALVGAWSRWWWVTIAVLAAITVALPETWRYPATLLNAHFDAGVLYGFMDVPLLLLPIIGWRGRTRTA